jgi:hypothetical protein
MYFNRLFERGELPRRAGDRLFCPAARFAVCGAQKRLARLLHGNTAYIKEQLLSRFRSSERALLEPLQYDFLIAESV